jgi:predicted transcriptional regulator
MDQLAVRAALAQVHAALDAGALIRVRTAVAELETALWPRGLRGRRAGWDVRKGRRLWEAGRPLREIAAAVRATGKAVQSYARRHHWPGRGKGWRPGVDQKLRWIMAEALWQRGMTLREIAVLLQCPENTVKSARQRQEWTRQPVAPAVDWTVAAQLWEDDELSGQKIAQRVGTTRDALFRYAREQDWPRRGKGWQPKSQALRPRPIRPTRRRRAQKVPLTFCPACEHITTLDPCECCRQFLPTGRIGKRRDDP